MGVDSLGGLSCPAWLLRGTGMEASRRVHALIVAAIGTPMAVATYLLTTPDTAWKHTMVVCCVLATLLLWTALLPRRHVSLHLEAATYLWTVALLIATYLAMLTGTPTRWHWVVVLLDLALVNQLPLRVTRTTLALTCVCLVLMEAVVVGGLHDISSLDHICDCDSPPCRVPVSTSVSARAQDIIILLLDFYLTRGFAQQVLQEQASMQSTINTVQQVALRLGEYDVDSVAEILQQREGSLPGEMADALHTLEANLRLYRPYLPDALFMRMAHGSALNKSGFYNPLESHPAPQGNEATIVFTDIRGSTAIWEAAPEAMQKAISIHNSVAREVIQACGGYEVKTVGDAFMIAFNTPVEGVAFGLRIHVALLEAAWPASLLQVPLCAARNLWGGLTVRVGVNGGPVMSEMNTVTGRVDYFGHTVNVASRLEGVCVPGAVAVRAEVWQAVSDVCDAIPGPVQEMALKGVKDTVEVQHVWPTALQGRQASHVESADTPRSTASTHMRSSHSLCPLPGKTHQVHATVGVVQVQCDAPLAGRGRQLSHALATMLPSIHQSHGTLAAVLGNSVAVGWNLSRAVASHAESALHFSQSLFDMTCHIGLASGTVAHGDVGSETQRFVTVLGEAVHMSWVLSEAASRRKCLLLFAWLNGDAVGSFPSSLRAHLTETPSESIGAKSWLEPVCVYTLRQQPDPLSPFDVLEEERGSL